MDSRATALAKLVLGYLKSEKCKSAYNEFLQNSACFQRYSSSQSKYIATRYIGLTLEDIFIQYSDLSQIIQGRLEATNYYNEQHPNENLVDQLQYLLSNGPSSRPSTPGLSSQRSFRDEVSPHRSDVDTTQSDALPGNSPVEKYSSSKRKSGNRHGWKALATSSPSSSFEVQTSDIINTEVLAESLLENKEFHEKIAQTINKVVERQFDSTVKEVIQETERDPIFDKILEEIVGTSTNNEMSKEIGSHNMMTRCIGSPCTSLDNEKEKMSNSEEISPAKVQKPNKEKHNSNSKCTTLPDNPLNCTPQLPGSEQVANLENYFLAVPTTPSIPNPFYLNTMTSLLIPPIATVVVNKPPQSSAFITEQDIMKMPVILNDDRNIAANPTGSVGEKENVSPKTPAVPKVGASPKELQEFFKNYRPDETKELSTVKKTGLKRVIYPKLPNKPQNSTKKIDNLPETISTNTATSTAANDKECTNKNSSSDMKSKTPLSDATKKPTPKSSSHIRSLNFTTPPKSNFSQKPPDSEAKKVVKTLFEKSKPYAWDSDLREIVKSDLPLTKRAAVKKKPLKRGRKPKTAKSEKPPEPEKIPENSEPPGNSNENEPISSKETIVDKEEQFITPVTVKEPVVVVNPTKAVCNITSMLETPYKSDQHPKTPGVATPMNFNDDGTPFTKMLDANLNGVDINSIETPSLLNTPGFPPITPNIDMLSPYPNRPTDYSTGSSYYQPSDSEQNKMLEAEVRQVEKNYSELTINLIDHTKYFNKNIIGKKNLNLLKDDLSDCSQDSNENMEDSSWCGKESNDTVIFKKKTETPKKFYSLRKRVKKVESANKKPAKKDKKPPAAACPVPKQSPIEEDKTKSKKPDQSPSKEELAEQFSLARELEKKRLKMVNSLKEANETSSKVKKQTNGKFKIKPIAKVFTSKASKKRKRNQEMIRTVMNDLRTSDDSELDLSLSENESAEIDEKDLDKSKTFKTVSDVEAQNLIDGLKERGIHLMQNKSPKKQLVDNKEVLSSSQILESEEREIFDTFTTDECISIVYDGKNKAGSSAVDKPKASESDQTEFIGKIYLERIDKEVDIHLKQTDFFSLLDVVPKPGNTSPAATVQSDEIKKATNKPDSKASEDLTSSTSTRKEKIEENSPNKSRKRRFSDDSESEKTCTKMLKSLDLDSFLNIIHQEKEKETKPKK
ncbi:unnamed protein product [Phyllotreta striolata]|uniref:Uncharacterized protein n=1 Tax=Phyllotreta striolata TaxID=444603 RepID=A0A9N9TH94_PHYSR|nr:unnamed protein product [Phyllotreta striolata]